MQMRDLSARSDVALGTIYRYYSSKDHVLAEALVEWVEDLEGQIARRPPAGATTADRMVDILRRATRAMEREPKLSEAVITALAAADPKVIECQRVVGTTMARIQDRAFSDDFEAEDLAGIVRMLGCIWHAAAGRLGQRLVRHRQGRRRARAGRPAADRAPRGVGQATAFPCRGLGVWPSASALRSRRERACSKVSERGEPGGQDRVGARPHQVRRVAGLVVALPQGGVEHTGEHDEAPVEVEPQEHRRRDPHRAVRLRRAVDGVGEPEQRDEVHGLEAEGQQRGSREHRGVGEIRPGQTEQPGPHQEAEQEHDHEGDAQAGPRHEIAEAVGGGGGDHQGEEDGVVPRHSGDRRGLGHRHPPHDTRGRASRGRVFPHDVPRLERRKQPGPRCSCKSKRAAIP